MNKTIALVLGVIVVVGAGYLVISGGSTQSGATTVNGSMKELLAQGKSLKCAFQNTIAVGTTSGTVYVGNGKLHGDYTITQTGSAQVIQAHMTIDGPTMYYWMEGQSTGFKVPFDASKSAEPASGSSADASAQFTKAADYSCTSWTVDESVFSLPQMPFTDVTNVTPTSASAGAMPTGGVAPTEAQKCAACDQIPDASAKSQCRVALGCK